MTKRSPAVRRVPRSLAGVVLLVALVLTVATAPASGSTTAGVDCGMVVTTDIRLGGDLVDCPATGLVVGADNITIDLGGHVVGGVGVDVGIFLEGHTGVTVKHGSIREFQIGVLAIDSSRGSIAGIRFDDITGKGVILVAGATHNAVSHNSFVRNVEGGVGVFDGATGNTITDNLFSQDGAGVENNFADATIVERNTMKSTGSGVIVESSDNLRITDNEISHSVAAMCEGCGIGIQIYGNNILVARNTLIDSPRYGIELDDFQDEGHSPAIGNKIVANRVIGSGIGIAIGPEAGGVVLDTLISTNTVVNAIGDGIQLLGPSTGLETSTLSGNRALHNGQLGINTVEGTRDGGGNRAAGNGDPRQCVNILCSP
jgi:nitrous oxidase accessory protein NosD